LCGSGTLPLEAAMMAGDIAPGLIREHFGFHGWKGHREDIWQRLIAEARYRRDKGRASIPVILGFDEDRKVLSLARQNAERLELADKVAFARQDLFEFRHDFPKAGLVVTNPPYGKRLAASGDLPVLYRELGRVLRENFVGWRAAVITEDQELGKHIGIRASRFNTLYNGAIACKLIHFDIETSAFFRDDRLPASVDAESLSEQALMFRNRLQKNLKQQRRWAKREAIACYRVYDADLPEYAAAIDVYGRLDADEQWVCIQEYEAPATIDPAKAKRRTREIRTMTQLVFDVADDHLFYKSRARQRGDSQYERLDDRQHFVEVHEGRCRFLVNFEDYLDTGLFLDHRPLRDRLSSEAGGKRFLNLFAYTGTATVHAATGGAEATTTVDMSATYLDWARRNMALNDLTGEEHQFVQADCIAWLEKGGDNEKYDLILLDPPT
ncbi:MAG: bifunctional 23S rRNA (guanine(2069)-N(7))-methyltransferase RlmK/23S rRNA (guanine(2445)-N(2))-methyltransferase RlmL, partial [Pseudomonadales bacterium]|nr:bifunctional 23S rRNA (guanine(2069)-N(7))-methyltransferase RlmK/23S rRNA (guanine(2445)-N(2))-methyltransferase RlmL [Pseudomonadales bacterium]